MEECTDTSLSQSDAICVMRASATEFINRDRARRTPGPTALIRSPSVLPRLTSDAPSAAVDAASRPSRRVYLTHKLAENRGSGLGNQLFFYATLFGVASRDAGRHVPLWPDRNASFLRDAFPHLRLSIDVGNAVTSVGDFNKSLPRPTFGNETRDEL